MIFVGRCICVRVFLFRGCVWCMFCLVGTCGLDILFVGGKWVTIFLNRCINVVVVFIWCVYRVGLLKVKSQIPKSKIQNRKTSGTGVPFSNEKTDACFTIFCIYCVFCIKTICAHTCAPASRVGGCGMPAGGCSTRMPLLTARPRG